MKRPAKPPGKRRVIVRIKKIWRIDRDRGAWKVAFADFATAMMAFFLLLWLVESADPKEKRAISGYFIDPTGTAHAGADLGKLPLSNAATVTPIQPAQAQAPPASLSEAELGRLYEQQEAGRLQQLERSLQTELDREGSAFEPLRGQIFIDITALGLRIQIVDKALRPMFDLGSANLKPYSQDALHALAPLLDKVPNRIAISGHTDATPYAAVDYSNWELSVDRANSARRALLEANYPERKIAAAQGMAAIALFKPQLPLDPSNRRIAITVLKRMPALASPH